MMTAFTRVPLPSAPPSLADTDDLLGLLTLIPRCPEVIAVIDEVLDYRQALGHVSVPCFGCAGARVDGRGRPCSRCGGSGWEPK